MKRTLIALALLLVVGLAALAMTFAPATLPTTAPVAYAAPEARPPEGMRLAAIEAGKMLSQAAFAFRGGALGEPRVFGMGGILIQHPKGTLLFDTGFGKDVDAHFQFVPALMRATSKYEKEPTVAEQLSAAGITLNAVVLTHAHWDHVSGIPDLGHVPVWVPQAELDFIRSDNSAAALAHSFGQADYQPYAFDGPSYLGFPKSRDVFGDGSVVLVPAPGHTPGSIVAFITLPSQQRYALVGDLVWQTEGIELPAERPWLSRVLVDGDAEAVRGHIAHLHQIHQALPDLVIVPAHDRRVWDRLPKLAASQ